MISFVSKAEIAERIAVRLFILNREKQYKESGSDVLKDTITLHAKPNTQHPHWYAIGPILTFGSEEVEWAWFDIRLKDYESYKEVKQMLMEVCVEFGLPFRNTNCYKDNNEFEGNASKPPDGGSQEKVV